MVGGADKTQSIPNSYQRRAPNLPDEDAATGEGGIIAISEGDHLHSDDIDASSSNLDVQHHSENSSSWEWWGEPAMADALIDLDQGMDVI